MAVPNIFGSATSAIPLSQLDTNFATPVTIGNTAVQLGNTVTSFGNVTLTNVTVSSGNVTITGANVSGNLTFTGTGNRITGDFSNATVANRVAFQNSVTNGSTQISLFPNGTSDTSLVRVFNNSDPTNCGTGLLYIDGVRVGLDAGITGTGTYLPTTFQTGGSERARIDTSGNVGIGTASPAVKLDINGITGWGGSTTGQTAQIVGASSGIAGGGNLRVLSNTTQAVNVGGALTLGGYYTTTTASIDFGAILGAKENSTGGNSAGYLAFGTRPNAGNMTECMRITSDGNLVVNGTAALNGNAKISVVNPAGSSLGIATGFGTAAGQFRLIYYSSGTGALNFDNGSNVATLSTAGAWTNASDGRQKTNVTDIKYGLNTVLAVEPHNYNRIDCDGDFIGFVAQELKEHIPEVVFGSEDKSYSVDYGSLVAVAFKAIQEQQAIITSLTNRITALESA